MTKPTQSRLRELFDYDADTGLFTWRRRTDCGRNNATWNTKHAGKVAGHVCPRDGYRFIKVDRCRYFSAHLAWIYVHGDIPGDTWIDHKNRERADDRIANLRLATPTQNAFNRTSHVTNRLHLKGVHRYHNKYLAQIQIKGRKIFLGLHSTPEDASEAYQRAAKDLAKEFARP